MLLVQPITAIAQDAPVASDQPARIVISSIGTDASVLPLGQEEDGSLSAPTDPDTIGWYATGVGLGVPGNALLDGHVDWGGRLRAFGLLNQVAQGDIVQIQDGQGTWFTYAVDWVATVDATSTTDDLFAQGTGEEVTLITCGGVFDHQTHQYLSRVIVRASRAWAVDQQWSNAGSTGTTGNAPLSD